MKTRKTNEVAAELGYSPEKVRRMCEDGRFAGDVERGIAGAFRDGAGAHWRIPVDAVEHFRAGRVRRR